MDMDNLENEPLLSEEERDNLVVTSESMRRIAQEIDDMPAPRGYEEHCRRIAEEKAVRKEIREMTNRVNALQERTMDMESLNQTIVQVCEANDGEATMAEVMENRPPTNMAQYLFASLKLASEKKVKLIGQRGQLLEAHELTVKLNPQSEEN